MTFTALSYSSARTHTHARTDSCFFESTLTDTLPRVSREAGAVVTLQPPLAVAGKHVCARLAQLPCTNLATPAAIQNQRDSWGTLGGRSGAGARLVTQLAQHLQREHKQFIQNVEISLHKDSKILYIDDTIVFHLQFATTYHNNLILFHNYWKFMSNYFKIMLTET